MKTIQLPVDAIFSAFVLGTGLRSVLATATADTLDFDVDVVVPDSWEKPETTSYRSLKLGTACVQRQPTMLERAFNVTPRRALVQDCAFVLFALAAFVAVV